MAAAKPRVLVVEDDQESYNALSKILKHVGYDTLGAPTLAEGIALLDKSPRFVVLDLILPDGNGKDLLKHIRVQKLPIKVAIITGTADKAMLDETRVLEPDALFLKPLNVPRILAWLRQGGEGPNDLETAQPHDS
jgi:two-component system OmpR family response regulator/two-component system response regulator QseB